MSFLYIGTFGSFIGYSFAFGLVLQNQFGRTPLQAAAVTFIGPLLGSLIRPVGGWLSDRIGGARVTFWNFVAMAVGSLVCIWASAIDSLGALHDRLRAAVRPLGHRQRLDLQDDPGDLPGRRWPSPGARRDADAALLRARRISGAAIGIAGAVGAFGGLLINLAFRASFHTARPAPPRSGRSSPSTWCASR